MVFFGRKKLNTNQQLLAFSEAFRIYLYKRSSLCLYAKIVNDGYIIIVWFKIGSYLPYLHGHICENAASVWVHQTSPCLQGNKDIGEFRDLQDPDARKNVRLV